MSLDMIPAFSWSALIASIATLLTVPVAMSNIIYLYVDHTYAQNAFGGGKGMETWLGWIYSAPHTFVFVIMALGVLAEVAPVAARVRQPLRPVLLGGIALISTATIGAVTQTNHVLDLSGTNGDKLSSTVLFLLTNGLPLLGMLVALAVAMLSFKEGKPTVNAAFAFSIIGVLMILAGATG